MEGGKNSYYQPKKWVILYKKYEKIWLCVGKVHLKYFKVFTDSKQNKRTTLQFNLLN